MKTFAFLLALFAAAHCHAQSLTDAEIVKEAAIVALFTIDRHQTIDIRNHSAIHETNPVMGRHPRDHQIDRYFLAATVAHVAVARLLPPKYRATFQNSTILLELVVIGKNKKLGLSCNF